MSTSLKDLAEWFEHGRASSNSHMIVVCDTFDHEDYPVYVKIWQNFWTEFNKYHNQNMQRIMEVYDYAIPWSKQSTGRVWNVPPMVDPS